MTDAAAPSLTDPTVALSGGRLVVGVDGSDGSLAALRWALDEAALRGSTVHAVIGWSYHPRWGYSGIGGMFAPGYSPVGTSLPSELNPITPNLGGTAYDPDQDAAEAAVQGVLEASLSQILEPHTPLKATVTITSEALEGHAAQVLLGAVTTTDLLVVGSRGHGGFAGALLGSVSQHVVAHARCPVVVVPPPSDRLADPPR